MSGGNRSLVAETSEGFTVGAVWSRDFEAGWIARLTASVDYYRVEIDDAVQGRSPAAVLAACVDPLDPLFCDLAPRTSNGAPDVIDNRLQNIGGIEASGMDVFVAYEAPVRLIGSFGATLRATFQRDYAERTVNVDGSRTVVDRAGTHTDETFQRAFPDLRWTLTLDWRKARWAGRLSLRWTDAMTLVGGGTVGTVLFTDAVLSCAPRARHDWTLWWGSTTCSTKMPRCASRVE